MIKLLVLRPKNFSP
jgi:hypothetical protein